MPLLRPVALAPSGLQGTISQGFDGHFSWEAPGYLRQLATSASKGKRIWFPKAVRYDHLHLGIDYIVAERTPVRAVKSGTIVMQGKDVTGAYILWLRIRRTLTYDVYMLYYHLYPNSYRYPVGATVSKGATVALSGNTGWSTGPHLHDELIRIRRGASVVEAYRDGLRFDSIPFYRGLVRLRDIAP